MYGRLHTIIRLLAAGGIVFTGMGLARSDAAANAGHTVGIAQDAVADGEANVRETVICGLSLEGKNKSDRIIVDDLDILWLGDGLRYLPLLRLCEKFGLEHTSGDSNEIFVVTPSSDTLRIEWRKKLIENADGEHTVDFQTGYSDFTDRWELWVPESVILQLLGLDLHWDPNRFAYVGVTDFDVPRFEQMRAERKKHRKTPISTRPLQENQIQIPELFPPAIPRAFRDPSIGIIRPGLRFSGTTAGNLMVYRSLESWGRLLSGEYSLRLRQSELEWKSYTRLDEAYWYGSRNNVNMNLGDVVFGLHDLILPAASMTGLEFDGILGNEFRSRTSRSSRTGRLDFGQRQDFQGFAKRGSTVRLYQNDRLVDEQTVIETQEAPIGEGKYLFRGVNLTRGVRNDIRIEIIEPDSTIREQHREIIGSDQLLRAGQVAFMGGAGTRRLPDERFWFTQGEVVAGRVAVGLLPSMTFGPMAAYQRNYVYTVPLNEAAEWSQSSRMHVPRESFHSGAEWSWRLLDRNLVSIAGALSKADDDSTHRYAGRASLVSTFGSLQLQPQAFLYQPDYFNGIHGWLEDRQGYAVSTLWNVAKQSRITVSAGHVENNVNHDRDTTEILNWQRIAIVLPRLWKSSEWQVSTDHLSPVHDGEHYIWNIEGRTDLPWEFRLQGFSTWGSDFNKISGRKLMSDLGISDMPRSSRSGWEVNLSHRIFGGSNIALIHSQLSYRKRSYVDHIFHSRSKRSFQWRLQGGYDWDPQTAFGESQISYRLDRSGTGSIGLLARYYRDNWIFGLSLSLQPTITLLGGTPHLLTGSRLDPRSGGLNGNVFMDRNGNGLREAGEPGVGNIEIITDSGQRLRTSRDGSFSVPPRGTDHEMYVSLNPGTIPAFYDAVNGAQWAQVKEGALTEVNLSLALLNSVSGFVYGPNPVDTTTTIGLRGIVVTARNQTNKNVCKSVTAADGSYYLGELKSGTYQIGLDPRTLPPGYRTEELQQIISLESIDNPLDIEKFSFQCEYTPVPIESDTLEAPQPKSDIEYKKF